MIGCVTVGVTFGGTWDGSVPLENKQTTYGRRLYLWEIGGTIADISEKIPI